MHVHTCYSGDSLTTPSELIAQLKRKRLDGAVITDHDTVLGAIKTVEANRSSNEKLIIIPGIEVSTRDGHILGVGLTKPIPKGLGVKETIELIHEAGGITIAAHPQTLFKDGIGLSPKILSLGLDALEVVNSSLFPFKPLTKMCKRFAERHNMPQTAGSDSHMPETIGLSYTIIDVDEVGVDAIIEAVRRGSTIPLGKAVPVSLRIKKILKMK